jgi:hypothetical protein
VIVFDETGYFTYLQIVRSAVTPALAATRGSEIYLSSATWTGTPWHTLVEFAKEQEALATAQGRISKYHHIPCQWQETEHITPEWVQQKRQEHERLGTLPEFRRDVLGEWCEPSERFFPDEQVLPCIVDDLPHLKKSEQVLMSLDIGGHHSATVSLWGRYSPINRRIEVTNYYSFIFDDNRYVNQEDHTVLSDHTQLIDALAGIRFQYGNSWAGYDPGNQEVIPQLLEQSGWNCEPIRISSYPAKMTFLRDLSNALAEKRIVWTHPEITRQLQSFCPPFNKQTGKYDFPDGGFDYDIIACMGMLVRYMGTQRTIPFSIRRADLSWV